MHRAKSMLLPRIVEDVEGVREVWPEIKTGAVCAKNLSKKVVVKRQHAEFITLKN